MFRRDDDLGFYLAQKFRVGGFQLAAEGVNVLGGDSAFGLEIGNHKVGPAEFCYRDRKNFNRKLLRHLFRKRAGFLDKRRVGRTSGHFRRIGELGSGLDL